MPSGQASGAGLGGLCMPSGQASGGFRAGLGDETRVQAFRAYSRSYSIA